MKSDTRTRMHGISNLLHHSTLWLSCVSNGNKSEWGAPWRIFIFIFIYLYMDKWKFHNSFQFVELQQFIFHTFLFDCIAEKWRLQFAQRTLHKRRAKREPIPKMKSRCVNRKQREKNWLCACVYWTPSNTCGYAMVIIFYSISIISHRDRYYSKYAYTRRHARTSAHTRAHKMWVPVMLLVLFPRHFHVLFFDIKLSRETVLWMWYVCLRECVSGLTMSPLSRYCPFCRNLSGNILGSKQNTQFKVRRMNCQWERNKKLWTCCRWCWCCRW